MTRFANWCHGPTALRAGRHSWRLLTAERNARNERFLRWAVGRYPQDAELRVLLATTICASDPDRARAEIDALIDLGGAEDVRRLALAAIAMFHAYEYELAGELCDRADELPWTLEDLRHAAHFMNIRGLLASSDEDYEYAEDQLSLAVAANPDSEDFASDLAAFLAYVDRADEARDVVQAALDRGLDGRRLSTVRADLGV